MNFGENMIKWIKILYLDSQACVLVNGYKTITFPTKRGMRQGCPLSQILYDLYIEVLALSVRLDKRIEGIYLPGQLDPAKISQYADDSNFYLSHRTKLIHLFEILQDFEKATGAKIKRAKTKGICLGGAEPKDETNIEIQWVDRTGLKILGVVFFPDQLMTTNYNWTKKIEKLKTFTNLSQTRNLSLKGKVINLNSVGLAKIWYLATVIPIPKWLQEILEEIIFKYLWGEGGQPIAKKTIFLPKEKGGLGLLDPVIQSLALRTKHVKSLINPNEKTKWVHLARYWIGLQLGGINPAWAFLRSNRLPKPDRDIYPEYLADCLNFLKKADITNLQWTTQHIRSQIQTEKHTELLAEELWRKLGKQGTQWTNAWKGIYSSHAPGKAQDVHYKFMHMALYTNQNLSKFQTIQPWCNACYPAEITETHIHMLFKCKHAFLLWNKIIPLLKLILTLRTVKLIQILFNTFPNGTSPAERKLALTLTQITAHTVWLNRNNIKHKGIFPNLETSHTQILHTFRNTIKANYNKRKRENEIQRFRTEFCFHPQICSLDPNNNLTTPFYTPT